jgi:hypothetical protein
MVLTTLGALALTAGAGTGQEAARCNACHGSPEYLRQQVSSMAEAEALHVTEDRILASAHAENACSDCHTGVNRYPHAAEVLTETCASCHEPQEADWHESVHARTTAADTLAGRCEGCHTIHDVAWAEELEEGPAMERMNAQCLGCHTTSVMPDFDPHGDSVSCAGCHGSHNVLDTDDAQSLVAPINQVTTCASCHEEEAAIAAEDVHGTALLQRAPFSLKTAEILGTNAPPSCTSCHGGGHGMAAGTTEGAIAARQAECAACHSEYADRYYGSYHGKATALGSDIVASCSDCHTAHQIYPDSVAASSVHSTNLVATCGECHEASREAFVLYDNHPDPMDRSRNAPLFFSFVFMNALLLGVLAVFGLHTLLWWVRIIIDMRRGTGHGGAHA